MEEGAFSALSGGADAEDVTSGASESAGASTFFGVGDDASWLFSFFAMTSVAS